MYYPKDRNPWTYYQRLNREKTLRRFTVAFCCFVGGFTFILITKSVWSIVLGVILFNVACTLLAPKFVAHKLAFLQKVEIILAVWTLVWVAVGIGLPSGAPPASGAILAVPGEAVNLSLGQYDVPAIEGKYRSSLSSCEFLPTDEQRTWSFDPIASHHTEDGDLWAGKDYISGISNRPIYVSHKIVLSDREEMWDTLLTFKLALHLEWPEFFSRHTYTTDQTLSPLAWKISIRTYSKHGLRQDRIIIPLCWLVGIVPLSFVIARMLGNRIVKGHF